MPFRLNEFRAKIQFLTSAEMPSLIYRACVTTGTPSNTRYVQVAVAERLSRDLDIPVEDLLAKLPPTRDMNGLRGQHAIGSANTVEEVR